MKFLMFVCDEAEPVDVDDSEVPDIEEWVAEMDRRGIRVVGERLRPPEDSRTVRVRGGERLVTDGPFAEGKEYIGGFDLLECASIEEAYEVAARHPMAYHGGIEIRPLWED